MLQTYAVSLAVLASGCTPVGSAGGPRTEVMPMVEALKMPGRADCRYEWTEDDQADGQMDDSWHRTYDHAERVIAGGSTRRETRSVRTFSHEYDEKGCNYLSTWHEVSERGDNSEQQRCTCDDFGNPLSCQSELEHPDGSGTLRFEYKYRYEGDSDRIVRRRWTIIREGRSPLVDERRFAYDEQGREVKDELMHHSEVTHRTTRVWLADDRIVGEIEGWRTNGRSRTKGPSGATQKESTFDQYNRYDVTTLTSDQPKAKRPYTQTDQWYDTIYHLRESTLDYDIDGTIDVIEAWNCTEAWPWSCRGEIDGRAAGSESEETDDLDDRPVDDIIDDIRTEAWTCP